MHRRIFIKSVGLSLAFSSLTGVTGCRPGEGGAGGDLLSRLIALSDSHIPRLLQQQELTPGHPRQGGFINDDGIYMPNTAAGIMRLLASVYVSPSSRYFKSPDLQRSMAAAVAYLLKEQHEDGTIDLLSTNFHSTPDTAFAVEPLCLAYTMLQGQPKAELETLLADLEEFLVAAGGILRTGGIHTPNHRWVVCMALSRLNALFPNPDNLRRIEEWLAEGIDIDPDGQYTEKSSSIYSPLTNRCFITLARLLDRPDLLEPVRRNLEMTLYYLHPNGEIVTEASGRQDQFRVAFPDQYYYPYRFMALRDGNHRFASFTRLLEAQRLDQLWSNLCYFLEDEGLRNVLPEGQDLPVNYVKSFKHSHLVRIRREAVDATILAKNHTFFTFFKNSAALQSVQLSMAFFGEGKFESAEVEERDGKFRLHWQLSKGYYQPFPADRLPGDGDWEKMPREERPRSEEQHLEARVTITEENGRFHLDIDIQGTDDVPVSLEFAFRHGGELRGVEPVAGWEDAYLLKERMGEYSFEGNRITFGPGVAHHQWLELRGGLAKKDAMSVYLTGLTPFRQVIEIR